MSAAQPLIDNLRQAITKEPTNIDALLDISETILRTIEHEAYRSIDTQNSIALLQREMSKELKSYGSAPTAPSAGTNRVKFDSLLQTLASDTFEKYIEDSYTFEIFTDPVLLQENDQKFCQTVERQTFEYYLTRLEGGPHNEAIEGPYNEKGEMLIDWAMRALVDFYRTLEPLYKHLVPLQKEPETLEPTETTAFFPRHQADPPVPSCWDKCSIM